MSKICLFFVVKTQSKCEKKKATMALFKYLGINDSTSIGTRATKFSKYRTHINKKPVVSTYVSWFENCWLQTMALYL